MIQDTLTESQKQRISRRLNLNFNDELLKSKILKERKKFNNNFRTQLDILIDQFYNDGVMFYGFTIVRPFIEETEKDMWYYIHLKIEDLINYLKDTVELVEFCYISIDMQKKKRSSNSKTSIAGNVTKPYFRGVLGVRSLLGQNKSHFNEIRKILDDQIDDVKLIKLVDIKSITDYWNFIIKNNNFKFHRFAQYSRFYEEIYGSISDLELQYDPVEHVAFGLDENFNSKYSELSGIKIIEPMEQTKINYLMNIFMKNHGFYLYKNQIYRSNWEFYDSIDYFNNNNIEIFEELKLKYPQQLAGLNLAELFFKGWSLFFEETKKNNHYLPNLNSERDSLELTHGFFMQQQTD